MAKALSPIALSFFIITLLIGVADYVIKEAPAMRIALATMNEEQPTEQETSSSASSVAMSESSSSRSAVAKGVSPQSGPNVKETLVSAGLSWTDVPSSERILIGNIDAQEPAQALTMLLENDRVATIAWIDTPNVKTLFSQLKEELSSSFSGNVTDLVDETVRPNDGAPRDVLSFRDPALSAERYVFVRIRERFYEIHVVDGEEERIAQLIEKLGR